MTAASETNAGAARANWTQNFAYDRFGNRISFAQNLSGIPTTDTPTIDAATNRFNTGQNIGYDKNGNIISDVFGAQARNFVFDGENKQKEIRDANIAVNSSNPDANLIGRYAYDGEGKRVKKETNTETTIFVYSGGKLIQEYSTKLADQPSTNYTTSDHLGTPRIITDELGAVKARRDFMPFGEELLAGVGGRTSDTGQKYSATEDEIRQKFTGYQKDSETQLDFAEARMYNNAHGRFTAVDPLLASGKSADPQSFNRYVYVGNNPLNETDPSGMNTEWVHDKDAPPGVNRPTWVTHEEFLKNNYEEWKDTTYTTKNGDSVTLDRSGPFSIEGTGDNYLGWSLNGVAQGTGVYDPNYSSLKNSNTIGGWIVNAAEGSFQFPSFVPPPEPVINWVGKNGQTFSLLSNPKFYGNQYTGSRAVAIATEEVAMASRRANFLKAFSEAEDQFKPIKLIGKTGFAFTTGFALLDGNAAYRRGNTSGVAKASADGIIGAVGFFGGSAGAAVATVYNGVDIIVNIPDPRHEAHNLDRKLLLTRLGPE